MKPEVADAIRMLVRLVEQDVSELRDSCAEIDEREARRALETSSTLENMMALLRQFDGTLDRFADRLTALEEPGRESGEYALLNGRMAALTQSFATLDARIGALEAGEPDNHSRIAG